MHGDTGEAAGAAVHADVTVTFARPKRCFLNGRQAERVGHLVVADIGIPDAICDRGAEGAPCELIALPELARSFARRPWDAHKGRFGHVCVIGGADGFAHAPVLAALGAVRSGAGLVTLAVPAASACGAAAWVPEAMTRVLDAPRGDLSVAALQAWGRDLAGFDALVVGPGLTASERARGLVAHLLGAYDGKLVLDADGLNALAALRTAGGWRPRAGQRLLLTPHPGEAARLLEMTTDAVQADRLGAVKRLAEMYQATVVLKGAGSLVCGPGGVPRLNGTGNPGMACGGMGDVLAGMAGALWAQGWDAEEAAVTAVWAHGAAGDFAAFAESRASLSATTLVRFLSLAFQTLERQSASCAS
jgi:NAD(P)H-hydrate epimerase